MKPFVFALAIVALLLVLLAPQGAAFAQSKCALDVQKLETLQLSGKLTFKTFPGPPNYEDVRKGDTPEEAYILILDTPVCASGISIGKDKPRVETQLFSRVHLLFDGDADIAAQLRHLKGKHVSVQGANGDEALTGHHHAPFIMDVKSISESADQSPQDHVTLGYANEGKFDADKKTCLAFVKEITIWSEAETAKGAKRVCAARRRHLEAYAALQQNYRALMRELAKDVRLDPAAATANLKSLVNACIEHKFGLTTGGHNILIDVIENDIDAKCLVLASRLLRDELAELRSPRPRF